MQSKGDKTMKKNIDHYDKEIDVCLNCTSVSCKHGDCLKIKRKRKYKKGADESDTFRRYNKDKRI